jgi:hypothetical protein
VGDLSLAAGLQIIDADAERYEVFLRQRDMALQGDSVGDPLAPSCRSPRRRIIPMQPGASIRVSCRHGPGAMPS